MTPSRWQQIEELYHAALECEPGERAAFLARVDPDLRGEVESLLAQDSVTTPLDRPAWEGAASLLGSTVALLTPGTQLGPYKIEGPLGSGGMGEVFRGVDTRLGRRVAVKTSREQFNARFDREARAISSLNHPHICTLYDVGPNYLVMELCEGETLASRLKRGKLFIQETLRYGAQIADALAAAHAKGITHCDLKPGNIMLTKAGVKVLDFGLAKSQHDATMTASNVVMGTPAYMAPEQREGKECDARTDIYALGLVLYEMSTGKRGEQAHTPPMEQLPEKLAHVIELCIAQDPDDRWQSASDLKRELAWVASASGEAITSPAPSGSRLGRLGWIAAGVSTLALIVAAVLLYSAMRRAPSSRPLVRLNAEIAPDTPLARVDVVLGIGGNMLALSPDGARLALTLRGADGKVRLHTRLLNQSQVTPLAGTENAYSPFFSPAGDWIGFFAEGKLKKIAVEGGAAVTLCDAPAGFGASWGDDGNIIAALNNPGTLSRVPSGGGTPVPVMKFKSGEAAHRWPEVLPGSQAVLFTASQSDLTYDDANIDVISLKTGERKTIQRGGFSARYLADATGSNATGRLIYLQQSTLFAVPFDPGRLAPSGTPAPILEDVSSTLVGGGDFAFAGVPSGPGTFVYVSGKGSEGRSISWVDRSGKTQPLHAPTGRYFSPRFSPDGKRLAFGLSNGKGSDIWVKDLDRDTPSRLSFLPAVNRHLVWTPDGNNIVFQSQDPAAPGLYGVRSDGSGEAQRLTENKTRESPFSFSPDGKRLAIHQYGNGGSLDVLTMPVEVDPGRGPLGFRLGNAELFLGTPFFEGYPAFSPDGRWLAYQSNESGTHEVYVRPFPGPGGRWQVSTGGGQFPLWSRDGRELLFETLDQRVMAVSYTVTHTAGGDSFAAGKPRVWTETRLLGTGPLFNYDLAPDGKRLAALLAADAKGEKLPTHLTFLLNFSDELRRKAPTGK